MGVFTWILAISKCVDVKNEKNVFCHSAHILDNQPTFITYISYPIMPQFIYRWVAMETLFLSYGPLKDLYMVNGASGTHFQH